MSKTLNSTAVETTISRAYDIAIRLKHEYIMLEHVLRSLLEDDDVIEIFSGINADIDVIREEIDVYLNEKLEKTVNKQPKSTVLFERVKQRTIMHCVFAGRLDIMPKDLFVAIFPETNTFAVSLLAKYNIDQLTVTQYIADSTFDDGSATGISGIENEDDMEAMLPRLPIPKKKQEITKKDNAEPAWIEQVLSAFCINLNEQAKNGKIDPLIGREEEILTVAQVLARRKKNNVLMTGNPGVGKTAVPEGLALKIINGDVPDTLKDAVLYSLDVASLLAGAKYRGEFEKRLKMVLNALKTKPHSVLVIDEIHMVNNAGSGDGGANMANILKPYLARGELQCIGGTTPEEYRSHVEKDRALARRFYRLDINEPSVETTIKILQGLRAHYEKFHGVEYTDESLEAAVNLSNRYLAGSLPDKAIDIIDAVGAAERIKSKKSRKKFITHLEIEKQVSKVGKIPPKTVQEDDAKKLEKLEKDLKTYVFDQDQAIDPLVDSVYQSRAGLRDKNKPLLSVLFTGPTGTGKTESAKTLAKTLNIPLIRFDMSEYQEKHSVATLIGSRPGYVGYGDGNAGSGILINEIEKTPNCVLLLDEIEKAHPEVLNILLQVMDHGKLTSGSGKSADFRNVYLIMTSNAGAQELEKNSIGFGKTAEDRIGADDEVINRMFTPEFRNRLDGIIKFKQLTESTMIKVVDKFIKQLNELASEKNIKMTFTTSAKKWLAKIGYDPKFGARPLERVIRQNINSPLSREILFGKLKSGGLVKIDIANDKPVFEVS